MSAVNDNPQSLTPIRPHLLRFAIVYVVALAAIALLFSVLPLKGGGSGAASAALVSAAIYAAGKFVEELGRPPSKRERRRLVWGSLAIALMLQMGIGLWMLGRAHPGVLLVGGVLIGALYWLGLRFAYSEWMAERTLKGLRKRQSRRREKQA